MRLNTSHAVLCGLVASLAAVLSAAADFFSVWVADEPMLDGFAVSWSAVSRVLASKPLHEALVGNYLGQYLIPIHAMFGGLLSYQVIQQASQKWALLLLLVSVYGGAVGAGFHAQILPAAALLKTGNEGYLAVYGGYWNFSAYCMLLGVLTLSSIILIAIISGRTRLPRWFGLFTPLGFIGLFHLLLLVLPDSMNATRAFLAASSFNLPLGLYYMAATVSIKILGEESGSLRKGS